MNAGKTIRKAAATAGALALAVAGVVAGSGTANAAVWDCGGGYCTTAVYSAPVWQYVNESYKYYTNAGETIDLTCHTLGYPVYYLARRPGWAHGWIIGDSLATGQDPNPLISVCV